MIVPQVPAFTDDRGTISDLLPPGDYGPPTLIRTKPGAVRGNHVHHHTTQWVYMLQGQMLAKCGNHETLLYPGDLYEEPAGKPHAWKAISNTWCLVFTQGPRTGTAYESDTVRLEEPLL